MKAVRVRVSGRVQGVWFRAWTESRATSLGLSGWVRNRDDGDVEALFAGADEAVEAMIEECRAGPPGARVSAVAAEPASAPGSPGFRVLASR